MDVLSPKARRKTGNRLNADLRKRKKLSISKKQKGIMEHKLDLLERRDAHPRRPRCTYLEELL